MAIEMGTSAPAAIAWNTLAPMSHSIVGVTATTADPAMNRAMNHRYRRLRPKMSDSLPTRGMADT